MPWKEKTREMERTSMYEKYRTGLYTKSELAREYGVSRPTLDKWIGRAARGESLEDRPPIPGSCPHRTPQSIIDQLLAAKRKHAKWGASILIPLLEREDPTQHWPSVSTANEILRRHNLVKPRRRGKPQKGPRMRGSLEGLDLTEGLTTDFKGQFKLQNGRYCFPLTIASPASRYIYAVESLQSTATETALPVFERVFKEHGVPRWILSDNGTPFCCSRSLGTLSRLSVWWIKLGIQPLRIRKGSPWQNGIHERMHKTLGDEATRPPEADHRAQQRAFDHFCDEFNFVRPHDALGKQPPAALYLPFRRPYVPAPKDLDYPLELEVRRVRANGVIKWRGELLFLSESLVGERVALQEIDDGIWTIWLGQVEVARLNERTGDLL